MTNLSDMLPEVLPSVTGCPEPLAINAIRNAAIKFCEKTQFWEVDIDPIMMISGVPEYDIDQPENQRIIRVSQVIGKQKLVFKTVSEMDFIHKAWRTVTGRTPIVPVMMNPRLLRMYPVPDVSGESFALKAIVKPAPTATVIDDYVYDDFYTAIAAGAKAELCAMPGKAWTQYDLVPYYQSLFDDGVSSARMRVASGFANAPMRARYHRLGG